MAIDKSQTIGKLAEALSAAQSELNNAKKDTQAHGYKHAKLDQIIDIIKPVFSKHGLSFIQPVDSGESGLRVSTIIMHSSGEWIQTTADLPPAVLQGSAGKNPVQVAGSAITYMRRYQLSGMVGIAEEDDDAQGYTAPKPAMKRPQPTPTLYPLSSDIFEANKHAWAKRAQSIGQGGIAKMKDHIRVQHESYLDEAQDTEIREIIMEIAKQEQDKKMETVYLRKHATDPHESGMKNFVEEQAMIAQGHDNYGKL